MKPKPTKNLPDNYVLHRKLSLLDRKSLILVNLWGFALFVVSAVFFPLLARWLSGAENTNTDFMAIGRTGIAGFIGLLVGVTVVMIVVHEGLHGLFFWLYTHEKPRFAFKGFYAYAAMPGWYLPRREYLITALAPLVGITVLGVLGLALLPGKADAPLLLLLILNTSGAVGDLWIAGALLRAPAGVLGSDSGDSAELYVPENNT